MNRTLVLGYFGYVNNQLDGQTIKSRNVLQMLQRYHAESKVEYFDTQTVHRNPIRLLIMWWKIARCNTLIYIPAHNNLKLFFLPIYCLSKMAHFSIIYVVVGGWLAEFLKDKPIIASKLKNIKAILPETVSLVERLNSEYDYSNVELYPNFRINSYSLEEPKEHSGFRIVFFARINKMKGLETAFVVAKELYERGIDVNIDFWGPIYEKDRDYFEEQIALHPTTTYKGVLAPDKIMETMSDYDILLFPTLYKTEGFPGSILDAYCAGVTVVASDWDYAHQFVDDGVCGFVCPMGNSQQFTEKIMMLYHDNEMLQSMRKAALEESKNYSAEKGWEILSKYL